MSESRSIIAYKGAAEARDKFDYFVCGVAGALFAYLGEQFTPRPFRLDSSGMELAALLSLGISFVFGLKRLEMVILAKDLNVAALHASESAGKGVSALQQGYGPFFNSDSGEMFNIASLTARIQRSKETASSAEREMVKVLKKAFVYYQWRNRLLSLGFLLLFLSKLVQGYHR